MQHESSTPHGKDGSLSRIIALVFAIAAGLSVANIYFAQPLLESMAQDFGIAPAAIGLVVTLTQLGYGLGLIFIVPMGDLVDRRKLVVGQGLLSVVALIAVGTAKTEAILFAGMAAVGLFAVMVQVLVSFAATLATPAERGKAVGMVTSGVVIGILGARFFAGMLADLAGWRAVYLTSAGLTLAMAGLLWRVLPRNLPPESPDSYAAALRSIPLLFLADRVVLGRGILALLIFAAFSTFWTRWCCRSALRHSAIPTPRSACSDWSAWRGPLLQRARAGLRIAVSVNGRQASRSRSCWCHGG